jgi:hypothetical protein
MPMKPLLQAATIVSSENKQDESRFGDRSPACRELIVNPTNGM